jgi:hypothetical protein
MKILWRVSNGKCKTDYIRADSLDEAKAIFDTKYSYLNPSVEFQPVTDTIHAVYFSDNPYDPAYFKGTKEAAKRGAKQYIRQWNLDATISRIETR